VPRRKIPLVLPKEGKRKSARRKKLSEPTYPLLKRGKKKGTFRKPEAIPPRKKEGDNQGGIYGEEAAPSKQFT